jgi:hypothetical protein
VPTPNLPSLSLGFKVGARLHRIAGAVRTKYNMPPSFSFAAAIFFGWIIRRIINTSRGRRARECSGAARRRLVPLKLFRALVARVSLSLGKSVAPLYVMILITRAHPARKPLREIASETLSRLLSILNFAPDTYNYLLFSTTLMCQQVASECF